MKSKLPKEYKYFGGLDRVLYRKTNPYFTLAEAKREAVELAAKKYSVYIVPFNDKYIIYTSQTPNRVRGMISGQKSNRLYTVELPNNRTGFYLEILQKLGIKVKK